MPDDTPLCPKTRGAIETIARRLRRLPCENSFVAMNLHRVARDLEAIAARHGTARSRATRHRARRQAASPQAAVLRQTDCSAQ
jgi:hypothetical protein